MKVAILCSYYNRPKLFRKSLQSILSSTHQDVEVFVCDDGSDLNAEEMVRSLIPQAVYHNTGSTIEDKLAKGIQIGKVANLFLSQTSADLAITLGDDDELVPDYLERLVGYFHLHPNIMYAWSKIHLFNPLIESSNNCNNVTGHYNNWSGSINPVGKLDTSQVAYRVDCYRAYGIRYPETTRVADQPGLGNIDAPFFEQLYRRFGDASFTGLIGQFKGIHDYQMVWHKKKKHKEFREYLEAIKARGSNGLL